MELVKHTLTIDKKTIHAYIFDDLEVVIVIADRQGVREYTYKKPIDHEDHMNMAHGDWDILDKRLHIGINSIPNDELSPEQKSTIIATLDARGNTSQQAFYRLFENHIPE